MNDINTVGYCIQVKETHSAIVVTLTEVTVATFFFHLVSSLP